MTDEEFLIGFAEIVGADGSGLSLDTPLAGLEGWDSVAFLGTMVFIDENLGVALSPDILAKATTVREIVSCVRAL